MAEPKPLYSTCVAVLGFVCLIVGATALFIPIWGYFDTANGNGGEETGYFGPWKTCKLLLYNRERCGTNVSKFRPKGTVWASGVIASIAVAVLGIFCLLSVLQLAMISSKDKVVIKYSLAVISKVIMALIASAILGLGLAFLSDRDQDQDRVIACKTWKKTALVASCSCCKTARVFNLLYLQALLAIVAAGLFALQTDERATNGFQISRGPSFYLLILLIVLDSALFVMSIYDMLFARRQGGDPTETPVPAQSTTYGNPGFRERRTNGAGISMTDASGKPYTGASNGSMVSMNTTSTTLGSTNGSTIGSSITRSPLRSSLKKPKPKPEGGLGIQNPGFSGTSPTMGRNGSMKKVRIQTHSTEV